MTNLKTNKLRLYDIEVTETCKSFYTVQAHNVKEANELFEKWVNEEGADTVARDLSKNCLGWAYSTAKPANPTSWIDVPYKE